MDRVNILAEDRKRNRYIPSFQVYFRKAKSTKGIVRLFYKVLFRLSKDRYKVELPLSVDIGGGLYIGHPYCITINPKAKLGRNCNIHKGVTIGKENRGVRKGVPTIGDCVWIGVNATIVGKINIGNDVLIAPNSYVNCDVPSHSIVFGNPCIIKHKENATEGYINNKV